MKSLSDKRTLCFPEKHNEWHIQKLTFITIKWNPTDCRQKSSLACLLQLSFFLKYVFLWIINWQREKPKQPPEALLHYTTAVWTNTAADMQKTLTYDLSSVPQFVIVARHTGLSNHRAVHPEVIICCHVCLTVTILELAWEQQRLHVFNLVGEATRWKDGEMRETKKSL